MTLIEPLRCFTLDGTRFSKEAALSLAPSGAVVGGECLGCVLFLSMGCSIDDVVARAWICLTKYLVVRFIDCHLFRRNGPVASPLTNDD